MKVQKNLNNLHMCAKSSTYSIVCIYSTIVHKVCTKECYKNEKATAQEENKLKVTQVGNSLMSLFKIPCPPLHLLQPTQELVPECLDHENP